MNDTSFLRQVSLRSIILMLVITTLGLVFYGPKFSLSVVFGAAFDISTFYLIALVAWRLWGEQTPAAALKLVGAFLGRLVLKALILVLAFLFPSVLNVWGTLIGILMLEITLFVSAGTAMIRRKPIAM